MEPYTTGRSTVYNADELANLFDSFNLIGRTIVSIDIMGRATSISLESMRNTYQNIQVEQHLSQKYHGKTPALTTSTSVEEVEKYHQDFLQAARIISRPVRVYRGDIPSSYVMNRYLSSEGPCLISLDDGRVLYLHLPTTSVAIANMCSIDNCNFKREIETSGIMAPIIGKKIEKISVVPLCFDDAQQDYIDATKSIRPFRKIMITCGELVLQFDWIGFGFSNQTMTLGELERYVSYFDECFDKRDGDNNFSIPNPSET